MTSDHEEKKERGQENTTVENDYRSFHAKEAEHFSSLNETTRVLRDALDHAREGLEEAKGEDPEWDDFLSQEEEEEGAREEDALKKDGDTEEEILSEEEIEEQQARAPPAPQAPRDYGRGYYRVAVCPHWGGVCGDFSGTVHLWCGDR